MEETGGLPRPHQRLRHGRLRVQAVAHLPQDIRNVLRIGEVAIAQELKSRPQHFCYYDLLTVIFLITNKVTAQARKDT